MDKLLLLIGLIIGSIVTWLIINNRTNARNRVNQERTKQVLFQLEARIDDLQAQFKKDHQEHEAYVQNISQLPSEISELSTKLELAAEERSQLQSNLTELQIKFETDNQERLPIHSQLLELPNQLENISQENALIYAQLAEIQNQLETDKYRTFTTTRSTGSTTRATREN